MEKLLGVLLVVGGTALGAAALGYVSVQGTALSQLPPSGLGIAAAAAALVGFLLLSRDHRTSDVLGAILLLAVAAGAGWVTFYAPEGTLERALPFIPASVGDELARLLFGVGAVVCVGMAVMALRRLF